MARSVILGNGSLTVGLNESGLVHDFYYPYVGEENLTTARSMHHRIGVSVNDEFSWVEGEQWISQVDLSDNAMIATSIMRNPRLGIEISTTDFVDYDFNAFCRKIKIKNLSDKHQTIKLFMHQVFEISNDGRADTAMYVPGRDYILDYKGRCSLLINGRVTDNDNSFDQYAVGNYGLEGKSGTYADAEDGELSNNPVEHGGVDTVIRFVLQNPPHSDSSVDYWVAAGSSEYECSKIDEILKGGLFGRINLNLMYWTNWFVQSERLLEIPEYKLSNVKKSLLVIKAHCDARGGIIASCDSSIYNYGRDYYSYVWPRDGALAIWPLIRLGFYDEARQFFSFCRDVITAEGFMMHKYQPDRSVGSTWHPLVHGNVEELAIQEDETAVVIFMLGEYWNYSHDIDFIRSMFNSYVVPAANFLTGFIDSETGLPHASYDLWEERFLTTTYTTSCVYAALIAASELAHQLDASEHSRIWLESAQSIKDSKAIFTNQDEGYLRKGFLLDKASGDLTIDDTADSSSFYAAMVYGLYEPEHHRLIEKTVAKISETIGLRRVESTGLVRYLGDNYFKPAGEEYGNPWIISTLWLSQYYIRCGNKYQADKILSVVESCMLPSGMLPEQVNALDRGPQSVTPLVWSHAEYINTILDYNTKFKI